MLSLCRAIIVAVVLFAGAVQPASASPITESFSFSFSDFANALNNSVTTPAPVDPWTGQFTITFDPSGGQQSGALQSFSSNLTVGIAGLAAWDFVYFGSSANDLQIGDTCNSTGCSAVQGSPGTAIIGFSPIAAPLGFHFAIYAANNTFYTAAEETITAAAVPEPGTLALLGAGLAALMGLLLCRGRKPITA